MQQDNHSDAAVPQQAATAADNLSSSNMNSCSEPLASSAEGKKHNDSNGSTENSPTNTSSSNILIKPTYFASLPITEGGTFPKHLPEAPESFITKESSSYAKIMNTLEASFWLLDSVATYRSSAGLDT